MVDDIAAQIVCNTHQLALEAQERFELSFRQQFPPGAAVIWDRAGPQTGTVLHYGYGERMAVRSARGAEYYVTMSGVVRALRERVL